MTHKLGVLVPDLGASQLAYHLIKSAGAALAAYRHLDIILFTEGAWPPCLPLPCAQMPAMEIWGYDGVVVATTLSTADKLLRAPGPTARFFYVWDLEWTRQKRTPYREFARIYRDPSLKILCRSEEHRKVFEDCWNREDVGLLADADLVDFTARFVCPS